MDSSNQNILIIGMSKMGKTHFGAQLYGRLKSLENRFQLRTTPSDLSLFTDVVTNLNEGKEGAHTAVSLNKTIELPIEAEDGTSLSIIYPDYGGEQLKNMMEQREIPLNWQNQIENSNHWFLFIRLDLIEAISDVTTKFYKQIEDEIDTQESQTINNLPAESAAFYIELLQVFLYTQKIKVPKETQPKITILLSCWDKLQRNDLPKTILKEKMPLLYHFLINNWNEKDYQMIGLSSLGHDLSSETPDVDYQIEGPEKFGYFITDEGEKETDLTKILNFVVI